ncbi:MAG: polysaccharide deacetylase family protein [Acidimicrobiia bacterium]|nr:polysaccharide deacetylase family protein [Acidimicrobiia bacterium]MDH4306506.1 polysaccharide deacetylase family protein [Acidimicrobiia bacterium]MDH5293466.1 polysaccharide deacetylase family protein [Acidimicrobiia bacterium]
MIGNLARHGLKAVSTVTDRFTGPIEGPRMLIYHQVGAGNGLEMDVRRDHFRRQMEWLQGKVITLAEALEHRDSNDETYVLTFDDGYEDMYVNAFPILSELGLPFVLYLTSGPIESRVPLRDDGKSTPVSWDQVETMIGSGLVTVGAHTHTHPDLRRIGKGLIEDEIGTSNRLIEERTGLRPRHFTYPWAYWSPAADTVVRDAYESATVGGCQGIAKAPVHALPRLPVQLSDGWAFFRPRVTRGFRLEDAVRRAVARYDGP